MALKKTIIGKNGTTTDYHRISNISCSKKEDGKFVITASVLSYVNESYRNQSIENCVAKKAYYFTLDTAPLNIYSTGYAELKKLDLYQDAIDVL